MYVRNSIEDFHVKHLSDAQMKELNMIIRQSLYDVVSTLEDDNVDSDRLMGYLIGQIPDYWEIPAEGHSIISEPDRTGHQEAA
jgi:hypothetical protein